jgi:hypothetical protein
VGLLHFSSYSNYTGAVAISASSVATLLAVVACVLFARHGRAPAPTWKLLGLVLPTLLILEATLFRRGLGSNLSLAGAFQWSPDGWDRISYTPWSDQVVLNALLFAPAGFAWTLARRRPFVVWLGLAGLSLFIELIQGATGVGAPDVADLIANSVGAALGATAAVGVVWLLAARRGARPGLGAVLTRAALLVVAVTVLVAFLVVGADRRQAALVTELDSLYRTSSFEQFMRWEKADGHGKVPLLTKRVFDRTSVRTDGMHHGKRSVTVRFPASFFGIHRCVFAIWTPGSFSVRRGSGSVCTTFIG